MRAGTRIVTAAALLSLGACAAVGPDYESSDPSLPDAYNARVDTVLQGSRWRDDWWTLFDDPVLDALIARGRERSGDIAIAASRIREARALARATDASTGPSLDGVADAGIERVFADEDDDDRGTSASIGGGLAALWEIDLFGGLYRTRQAAWAEAQIAGALHREAIRLTRAEIARTYVSLRALERRVALTERSLDLLRQTLDLVEQRVSGGLAPGLDQIRAGSAVALLEAELGPLRSQVVQARNALAVLTDALPGVLADLLAEPHPIPSLASGAAVGVPRDLVRRRPDIQAAEFRILAATADVGIRTAALYPRLTLPGSISVGRAGIGSDSVATTVVASVSAVVDIPIFDGGARRADITAAEERVIQATLAYRQTLLDAFREVEDALLAYEGIRDRREALVRAVDSNRQAFEQSQELYRRGFATFLDVLDSQRTWNASLHDLAIAERDLALAAVDLFSALGLPPETS